jgi:hypothetical protein
MNTRSLLVNVSAVLAIGAVSILFAQKLPRTADGHPDLNGTWDNGSGIDFVKPQHLADGSVCVSGCDPQPTAAKAPAQLPEVSAGVFGEGGGAGRESGAA